MDRKNDVEEKKKFRVSEKVYREKKKWIDKVMWKKESEKVDRGIDMKERESGEMRENDVDERKNDINKKK